MSIGTVTTGPMNISQVVSTMRKNIQSGRVDPEIKRFTAKVTKNVDAKNADQAAQAIYKFLRDNITYTLDPQGAEYLQNPKAVLKTQTGDCDDFTTLGSAMMESIGHKTRLVFGKQNGKNQFSHVWFDYFSPNKGKWIAMDAIVPKYPGWVSENITGVSVFDVQTGKSVNIGAGEASATVLAANSALAATGVGLPAAVALQAAAEVVDVVSMIIPKKYLTANWWNGKHSVWGKMFGKGYSISAQRANEALYNAFHDALGYELTDFDGFEKRHKGAFSVWVKWWNGKEWIRAKSRFGDGGTAEMIREIGDQIKNYPKPGFPKEAWAEAAKTVAARYAPSQANQPSNPSSVIANQATGQDWPVMPANPSGLNSFDFVGLGKAITSITSTAGQLYLKARSYGINESAPTPPGSILQPDVVKYWNQVNEYRNQMIAKAQGAGSGSGSGSELQESGMGTGAKVAIGLLGGAILWKVATSGSNN